jgi:predicted DNA-binding transcriptional regulator AlpA
VRLPPDLPDHIRTSVLARHLGVTHATIRAMVARRDLPQPVRLSARLHLFETAAVRAALDRLSRREGGPEHAA